MQRYQSNGGTPFGEEPPAQEAAGTDQTEAFDPPYENDLPPLPPRPGYHRPSASYERPELPPLPVPEVYEDEAEAPRPPRNPITFSIAKFNQFLKWLLWVIEVMFALRFFLSLLSTRNDNPFISLLTSITDPLLTPFKTALDVHNTGLQWYTLLAMLVYFLVIVALIRFLRLFVTEPEL
jgi:uncharacterized protein YggT (Ycf19 family)